VGAVKGAWECGTAGQGGVTVAFVELQAAVVGTGDDIRVVIAVEVPDRGNARDVRPACGQRYRCGEATLDSLVQQQVITDEADQVGSLSPLKSPGARSQE
jgi:hypothetical protein